MCRCSRAYLFVSNWQIFDLILHMHTLHPTDRVLLFRRSPRPASYSRFVVVQSVFTARLHPRKRTNRKVQFLLCLCHLHLNTIHSQGNTSCSVRNSPVLPQVTLVNSRFFLSCIVSVIVQGLPDDPIKVTVCDASALVAAVFQVVAGEDNRKVIFRQGSMSSAGTLVMHFGNMHFDMFSLMDDSMCMQVLLRSVMVEDVLGDLKRKLQVCNDQHTSHTCTSSSVRVTELQEGASCLNLRVAPRAFTETECTALRNSKHKLSNVVVEMGRLVVDKQGNIWQPDFVLLSATVGDNMQV